jgi:plasmid stability protein
MPTITLRNVSESLYRQIKERAERNQTSVSGEIIHCIETALAEKAAVPEFLLARTRELRDRVAGTLTEETLVAIKTEGRP